MARQGKHWSPRVQEKHSFNRGDVIVPAAGRYPEDALEVNEVVDDFIFRASPVGGGPVMRFGTPLRMKYQFRVVDPAKQPVRWYKAKFTLDMLPEGYEGWTTGQLWNGFATPSFDFETAKKILGDMVREVLENNYEGVNKFEYDPKKDEFLIYESNYPDNVYRVPGEWVTLKKGAKPVKVYDVGSWAWTWSAEEN